MSNPYRVNTIIVIIPQGSDEYIATLGYGGYALQAKEHMKVMSFGQKKSDQLERSRPL